MSSLEDAERLLLLDNVPYGDDEDEDGEDVEEDGRSVEGGGAQLEDTPSPPVILEGRNYISVQKPHPPQNKKKLSLFPLPAVC